MNQKFPIQLILPSPSKLNLSLETGLIKELDCEEFFTSFSKQWNTSVTIIFGVKLGWCKL